MELLRLEESRLPTLHGTFKMIAYDSGVKDFPHLAMVNLPSDHQGPVNIRIHSECLTGDLFGSSRCDCGEQLNAALDVFGKNQGVLIYLRQEGRGIGLINKMKAYNLQDTGLDTIKANHALGFHTDERSFTVAVEILKDLEIEQINLFTNNPEKVKVFDGSSIDVIERKPVHTESNPDNSNYLKVKKEQLGHWL